MKKRLAVLFCAKMFFVSIIVTKIYKLFGIFFSPACSIWVRGENSNMENTTLIIDDKEKEEAKALTQSFVREDVRTRAYVNALGSEICLKYLRDNAISDEKTYNMHNIRKIIEEFDISDIILSNIHIDVRVIYDENKIFIPKSHFEYNITPDIYVVLKIAKDYSNTELLGFFEPKMLNKNNMNDKYYFIEKEKLSSPIDLKNYIKNFQGQTSTEYSSSEMEDAEFLIISMADNNATEEDKKRLLSYLKSSVALRDKFIEFENFEMMSYQAANMTLASDPEIFENPELAALTADDIVEEEIIDQEPSAISNENSTDEKSEEQQNKKSEVLGNLAQGAAIAGAEIAGTAIASAALAGAAESVEIAKDAAGLAMTTTDTGLEILEEIANSIAPETNNDNNNEIKSEEISLDILDDIGSSTIEEEEPDISAAISENINSIEETIPQESAVDVSDNSEEKDLAATEVDFSEFNETQNNASSEEIIDSMEDFFVNNNDDEDVSNNDDEEITFMDSSSDDYGEIEFTNNDDYNDDIVFENNDDYDSPAPAPAHAAPSSSASSSHPPRISTVVHTPISEATDLVSLESLQSGNIAPQELPKSDFDQMETMELDEFKSLVDSYVPQEIKDESSTTDFNSVDEANKKLSEEHDKISNFNENIADMVDIPVVQPKEHEEDYVDDDLPDINDIQSPDNDLATRQDEVTSDDFVQEMPEEINSAEPVVMQEEEPLADMNDFSEEIQEYEASKAAENNSNENSEEQTVENSTDEISSENIAEENISEDIENNMEAVAEEIPITNEEENIPSAIAEDIPTENEEENTLSAVAEGIPIENEEEIISTDIEENIELNAEEPLTLESSEEISIGEIDIPSIDFEENFSTEEKSLNVEENITLDNEEQINKEETVEEPVNNIDSTPETKEENIEIVEDYTTSEINSIDDLSILDELESLADETDEEESLTPPEENPTEVFENNTPVEETPATEQFAEDTPQEEEPDTIVNKEESPIKSIEPIETPAPTIDINNMTLSPIDKENIQPMNEEDIIKAVDKYEENKIITPSLEEAAPISMAAASMQEEEPSIVEEPIKNSYENKMKDSGALGILYKDAQLANIQDTEIAEEPDEVVDYKPKKSSGKLISVFAMVVAIVIASSLVVIFMKNRNSIDSETLIQSNPENNLISPETDNSGILLNDIEPAIPTDATDMSPSAPAPVAKAPENPKIQVPAKPTVTQATNMPKKPLNANKTITLKKISWEVPSYLSYSEKIKKYLQSAGKSIKLTLSSDLLLTNEYIYSNQVKVSITLEKNGKITDAKIVKSSGSKQVDNIVLQTVKETLNVVKPPRGEVPTPNYKLGLIIYL